MSTANLFNLPLGYQYGVGSADFGAWRELVNHIMTSNWVITGECANFPIMYHWRILPSSSGDINIKYWGDIEKYYQYWENSDVIRKRVPISIMHQRISLYFLNMPHRICMTG